MAGCLGDDDDSGGGGETFEVGHGDYQTTISESDFPDDKLYAYAVQTGWSNWDAVMDAFQDEYGIELNDDQRTSGEALTHLRSNAGNPTHSVFNGGYSFAIKAMNDGLIAEHEPAGWEAVPDDLKHDSRTVTTRVMTSAITYRKDVYEERGLDELETWEDLKHPDIAKDFATPPPHAAVGLAALLSINRAYGGDIDNLDPVIEYLEELEPHGAEHRRNLLREFTAGEVSTFNGYDFEGLTIKYDLDDLEEDQVGVTIPNGPDGEPGALNLPYGFGLVEDAPNPETGKLFMDFVLSLEIQELFFDGFVRPIRADELEPPEQALPQEEYDGTEFTIDQQTYVEKQEEVIDELTERSPLPGVAG